MELFSKRWLWKYTLTQQKHHMNDTVVNVFQLEVEGLTWGRLKKKVQNQSGRGWDILTFNQCYGSSYKSTGSYISHNATKNISWIHPSYLVNANIFQTPHFHIVAVCNAAFSYEFIVPKPKLRSFSGDVTWQKWLYTNVFASWAVLLVTWVGLWQSREAMQ